MTKKIAYILALTMFILTVLVAPASADDGPIRKVYECGHKALIFNKFYPRTIEYCITREIDLRIGYEF